MADEETENRELQLKIDRYGDMLFRLSLIRLQNVQNAEDVVQETFYQYLRRKGSFAGPEHEKAWLIRVALNACRKVKRSAWNRRRDPGDWLEELEKISKSTRASQNPEEGFFLREEQRRLLEAVAVLPARYRDVIHLFYDQEMSVREIARATGRGESTVTSQLTRARAILRRTLKEEYDFD